MSGAQKGVLEREKAVIGVLITLEEPTKPMLKEALSACYYEPEYYPGTKYPRLQVLTIDGLLQGKGVLYPHVAPAATSKRAPRKTKVKAPEQGGSGHETNEVCAGQHGLRQNSS